MQRSSVGIAPRHRALVMRRFLSPVVSGAVALALIAASLVAGLTVAPALTAAAASGADVSITFDPAFNDVDTDSGRGKDTILAGEDATYTLKVTNSTGAAGYNLAATLVVPVGVTFVPGGQLGTPTIYSGTDVISSGSGSGTTTVAAQYGPGVQLWVWEDFSDLPAGGVYSAQITVHPTQPAMGTNTETSATDVFPAGSTVDLVSRVYLNTDPTLKPVFAGSTGVRTTAAANATGTGSDTVTTDVVALHVFKNEPSPEDEVMRGVHDRTTVYTLTVKNTTEGITSPATVVDYVPAGLEFLGCGDVDNTSGGDVEYPGAGRLDATTPDVTHPADCLTPFSVETVNLTSTDAASGATPGVYTKVTWKIASLAAGEIRHIEYRAGIPLFANTMTFPGGAPTPTSLGQAANLDNNTGPSTRHSTGSADYTDAQVFTNYAVGSGTYTGVVRTGGSRDSSDHDREQVDANDLRILKYVDATPTDASVPSGQSGTFKTGYLAKYRLAIWASEYTDVSNISITDTIPNGLCPILPAGTQIKSGSIDIPKLDGTVRTITGASTLPSDCDLGTTSYNAGGWANPAVDGATVDWVAYDDSTGEFFLHFNDLSQTTTQAEHSITYPVLMRPAYRDNSDTVGNTSAQDRLVNKVIFRATTTTIGDGTTGPLVTDHTTSNPETIADDSSATLTSEAAEISKKVLPHSVTPGTTGDICDFPTSDYQASTQTGFTLGDTVCYELRVKFDADVDTRNPIVTDVLPPNVTYAGSASSLEGTTDPLIGGSDQPDGAPTSSSTRITWHPKTYVDGDNFVPRGSTLVIHLWGTVSTLSADPATLDKPENLMKYQQENVAGDLFFLRDARAISIQAGVSLTKGVKDVNNAGLNYAANHDHVKVNEGDLVTYRIDVAAQDYPVSNLVVWDVLPAGITAADVVSDPDYTAVDPGNYPADYDGDTTRSLVVWNSVSVAAGATKELDYDVQLPGNISAGVDYSNTASIVSYDVTNNDGSTSTYQPDGTPFAGTDNVPGAFATDPSDVYLAPATIVKSVAHTGTTSTGNSDTGQVTHGETISYDIAVTIPAKTSAKNGIISDDGFLSKSSTLSNPHNYTFVSASVTYPDGTSTPPTSGFTQSSTTGQLTFPALYDNSTSSPQTFTVHLTVYSTQAWANGDTLYNQARFIEQAGTITSKAHVAYVQPLPSIDKLVDGSPTESGATVGQDLTYTLKASNAAGRPTLYRAVVTDCVPGELVGVGTFSDSGASVGNSADCASPKTLITWPVGDLAGGANKTLTYHATVGPTAGGGGTYVNNAAIVGDVLDIASPTDSARQLQVKATDTASVRVLEATISKSVSPTHVAVGDTAHYTVDVALPANVNFYSPKITDPAPAGLTEVTNVGVTNPSGVDFSCTTATGDITCVTTGPIASSASVRHVVITYDATLVSTTAARGDTRVDTATFGWLTAATGGDPVSITGSATLTVDEPELEIDKTVATQEADDAAHAVPVTPGHSFDYAITVTNPGGANVSTAYDAVITDVVPKGIDVSDFSQAPYSNTVDAGTGVRTLVWHLAQVAHATPVVLTYTGELSASTTFTPVASLTNTATVTSYASTADDTDPDRRGYTTTSFPSLHTSDPAVVSPGFPHIDVTKTAPDTRATVGNDFEWDVTFTNSGAATAKTLVAKDTLPHNWTYTGGMTATLNGTALTLGTDYTFDAATLTWTFHDVPAAGVIAISYTAKPGAGAWTDPGVGTIITAPHTNDVTITSVTDDSNATGNAVDTDYHGTNATADAYLVATDIAIQKTLVTATPQINVGDVIEFKLAVTNNGQQDAQGVEVTDALPAGLTFTGLTGNATPYGTTAGWACDTDAHTISTNTADCTYNTAIPAGQTREVHIFALVQAIPGAALTRSITNTADVTMTTPEDPSKLTDNTSSVTITAHAPLISLVKTGTLAAGATGVPGDLITYTFTAKNLDLGATIHDVTITDPLLTPSTVAIPAANWPGTVGILGPGESVTTTATYAITQADLDAGLVTNLAEVDAVSPLGDPVVDTDGVTVPLPSTPSISLTKDGALDVGTTNRAGDGVTWSFEVTNTGNMTLSSVSISDALAGLSNISYASGFTGTLAPGASVTATATSKLTQADVDAGKVDNTATATGSPSTGAPVTDTDPAEVTIAQNASVVLLKTSAFAPGGSLRAGDKVIYTFSATNTGNVTLTTLDITDDMPGLTNPVFSNWPSTTGKLLPGETVVTTAEYAMTQADVDRGSLTNHAIIVATPPIGPTITGGSTSTISIAPHPAIDLVKTAKFAPGSTGVVGDTVVFSFLVTNTGNVTLTGTQIHDAKPGLHAIVYGEWPTAKGLLGPGESVQATADYALTSADVLSGDVKNTANVSAVGLVNGVATNVSAVSAVKVVVPTGLAATGLQLMPPTLAMIVLIVLGSGLILMGRRRRHRSVG